MGLEEVRRELREVRRELVRIGKLLFIACVVALIGLVVTSLYLLYKYVNQQSYYYISAIVMLTVAILLLIYLMKVIFEEVRKLESG